MNQAYVIMAPVTPERKEKAINLARGFGSFLFTNLSKIQDQSSPTFLTLVKAAPDVIIVRDCPANILENSKIAKLITKDTIIVGQYKGMKQSVLNPKWIFLVDVRPEFQILS